MKGPWKMFTGQGGKEYRAQHRKFNEAIPDDFPIGTSDEQRLAAHPAYSGPMASSLDAENYRRAHFMRGPQSKREHARLVAQQELLDNYNRQVEKARGEGGTVVVSLKEWLDKYGIPLPERGQ